MESYAYQTHTADTVAEKYATHQQQKPVFGLHPAEQLSSDDSTNQHNLFVHLTKY